MFDDFDRQMMRRALELARQGLYTAHPNPRVGCVIVRDGKVVGEGWHRKAGEPHAEAHALAQAGEQARGATAYVSLEPCSHFGRTPPCADALIAAGVKRVVSALSDPNPNVNGGGVAKLIAAGIEVQQGLLEAEARELNIGFVKRMSTGLPWVAVKVGASLDGRTALANGASRWITSEASRADVQRWRARSAAILTGVGTILADDPQLNVREPTLDLLGRQPLIAVCDTQLRTPVHSRVLQQPGVLLFCAPEAVAGEPLNAEIVRVNAEQVNANQRRVDLQTVLRELGKRGCNEVWVEAGPTLSGRLLELRLADEVIVYLAPVLLGHEARPMFELPTLESMVSRLQLELLETAQFEQDLRLRYRVPKH